MKNHLITLMFLGGVLLLGNCQEKDKEPAPALTSKRWMLNQVNGSPITFSSYSHDYDSFIQFNTQSNEISGLAACSGIQGKFSLNSASQQLTITQLITNPGSCLNLNFATKYLAALPQTERYVVQGDKLLLYDGMSTGPRLVFRAAE